MLSSIQIDSAETEKYLVGRYLENNGRKRYPKALHGRMTEVSTVFKYNMKLGEADTWNMQPLTLYGEQKKTKNPISMSPSRKCMK